jgi:hypothetical protein
MKTEEGFLVKEKKIRKDRRHNERHNFDDDFDAHKRAGRRRHSKMMPTTDADFEIEIDDDDPYADHLQDWKRYLK